MSRCVPLLIGLLLADSLSVAGGFAVGADGPQLPPPLTDDRTNAEPPGDTNSAPAGKPGTPGPFAWSKLLRDLADDTIPRDFEKRDGWGRQTEIVSGVRIREKNGLPRISKRTKRVNHGLWRRYRIALHRPEEKLRFAIRDVQAGERGGLTFKVFVSARARCTAESEFWSYGARSGSSTVQADATVRIVARFSVSGRNTDPEDDSWLVNVEYVPDVDRVRIELDDLDVRRIGHLQGDLADGLGDTAQGLLAKVLQSQEDKVTRRIRRELAERDARITLTLPRVLWETREPSDFISETVDHPPAGEPGPDR